MPIHRGGSLRTNEVRNIFRLVAACWFETHMANMDVGYDWGFGTFSLVLWVTLVLVSGLLKDVYRRLSSGGVSTQHCIWPVYFEQIFPCRTYFHQGSYRYLRQKGYTLLRLS